MPRLKHNLSQFHQSLWLTMAMFAMAAITFVAYVRAEKQIGHANELRYRAILLADELRQSADDLTHMAQSYVITGDPVYKKYHQEILDIRDGRQARTDKPGQRTEKAVPLLDLFRQAGISNSEFAKLAEAKAHSDDLTNTELRAIKLVASSNPPSDTDRVKASLILHDSAYLKAKADVMRPIIEFQKLMDQRTVNAIQNARSTAMRLRAIFIVFGCLLAIVLYRGYRTLYFTLGGSIDDLHEHIARLGRGDFTALIPLRKGLENSIMGWIAETQNKLAKLEEERKLADARNLRMTNLYAALSQCNEAIMRCPTQEALFSQICRNAVTLGGMKMAWIGLIEPENLWLKPVAYYGEGTEYLDGIRITIDGTHPNGKGPTGTAMREDRPFWCQNFQTDPATLAWHNRGAKYGWKASACLPLHQDGVVIGGFTLYSSEPNAFDEAERNLLLEMTMNIDYALNAFEHDVQRKAAEAALAESHGLLKTIIDIAPVRIFWKDKASKYLGCNQLLARDAGEDNPESLVGRTDFQLCWREQAATYQADDQMVMASNTAKLSYEETQTTPDGHTVWLRTSKVPLRNSNDEAIGVLGVYEDITEHRRTAERIHNLANFDQLTGLPNRAQLNDRIQYAISLAKRRHSQLALMFLDLDHFKDINDTLGHSVGDTLLIELASRLRCDLREEDTITRMGGDEFIVLLPDIEAEGAAVVAQKLLITLAKPYRIEDNELTLTASIGIAMYPTDGENLESLAKNADTAMYRVKQEGRHGYRFFTSEMETSSTRKLEVLNALRHALENEEFQLYYQPQIDINDGRIIGVEALLRWRHPELGMVSPAEFIPIAENSGLILPIGEWVLKTATHQARTWLDDGYAPMIMAINLSAAQFRQANLLELIESQLAEADLAPHLLELELTEGVAMQNPQAAIAMMHNLQDRGIRLAIDDFGTGYSSLNYLKKFRAYKLKIDQSFVRDINTDAEDRAIVNAIINMAKSLGLKTIAEGVETLEQQKYLSEQGCDEMQGYLFSKPLPADELQRLLKRS
ncbi:MAG: bifunctional diguanylate cyclase/phosphodiesterase [Gammaproteobacteria bacterium]